MAAPFPLSDRASDVIAGCKTQRIAPTLRQVADLVCSRIKEREYFKTCIVRHVNYCLQCGPTLTATSVLQVSHDKSRRLQCGPTLFIRHVKPCSDFLRVWVCDESIPNSFSLSPVRSAAV
ncbi:hypothetical protein PoB_001287000 [Plakobranchus ocellatus]|uniref:Uncharacterized protein n=1 Tax=Plakobranchus ocellatus TaxID=259542 RepID=A0AAV3YV98_9GAST|nr:hypothetical protein PoB_001287000 [Plakobranchus ocellatus]